MKKVMLGCAIMLCSFIAKASDGRMLEPYPEGRPLSYCNGTLLKYGKPTKVELTIFWHMSFAPPVENLKQNMLSVLMRFPDEKTKENVSIIRADLQESPSTEITRSFMGKSFLRIYRTKPFTNLDSNFDTLEYTPGDEHSSIVGPISCTQLM